MPPEVLLIQLPVVLVCTWFGCSALQRHLGTSLRKTLEAGEDVPLQARRRQRR